MSERRDSTQGERSISLFGFLSVAGGCGILFSSLRYPLLWRQVTLSSRVAYFVLASLFILWGLLQIFGVWRKSQRENYVRYKMQAEKKKTRKHQSSGLMLGKSIVLLLSGFGILFVVGYFSFLGDSKWIAAAAGIGFVLWGFSRFRMWKAHCSGYTLPRNRIALPVPGAFYLTIMFVTALGAMIARSNMMLLVFSIMAGPFVVNGWFIFSMLKRTRVFRNAPKSVMAGEPVPVEFVFKNRKRFFSSWLMNVRDHISNENETLEAGVLFARIPPRSKQSGHYRLKLMQRGWYRMGPIRVTTRFPLGLIERGLVFDDFTEILVYPRLGTLLPLWNRDKLNAPELVQLREPRRGSFDDEFHRIREYHSGDNPRAIHWRTSARQNELMVREFYPTRDRNLVVLLDLHLPSRPLEDDLQRVELAVSFAATVCVDHMRQSRQSKVFVASAGNTLTVWEGSAGPKGIESLLETLAQIQAGSFPEIQKLIDDSSAQRIAGARSVLITTRPENDRLLFGTNGIEDNLDTTSDAGLGIVVINSQRDTLSQYFQLDYLT
ncbi:MAG: DUF58 domain-containing protein [Planctomycetes bacterium]|nr:DUF58 domain-containing protein [Planctomycetota bacterium]